MRPSSLKPFGKLNPGSRNGSFSNLQVFAGVTNASLEREGSHGSKQAHAVSDMHEDFILSGPLIGSPGLDVDTVMSDQDDWNAVADRLIEQLGFQAGRLNDAQRARVYQYYVPVFKWIEGQLKGCRDKPLVIGISAPQGCGKSTLVEQLELLFKWRGIRAATVSIDDFYLTYEGQTAVSAANPGNRLLQLRGNAGSHDLKLGEETLLKLKALGEGKAASGSVALPRYNKSAYGGRGDRAEEGTWPSVEAPLDVVLLEGWMLGFAPTSDESAAAVDGDLVAVNKALQEYKRMWDSHVDSWLVIKVSDPQWVYNWRLQAEQRMRESGKAGMTDQQIADFVDRFMPAYKLYLPGLYREGPTTSEPGRLLTIQVDASRTPVKLQTS